jgi:hypothetical protein
MAAIGWKFRYLPEDQKHTEPTHSQEFDRNGPARSLVREAIQNSLDAREDHSKPVRVRIKFGTTSDAGAHSFLDGLWPHLNVENVRNLLKCSKKQAAFRYLAFEDFNTRGLTGDVNGKSASHGATKNHFFCFWHKVGQSSNDHKTLGNRGVGKVAFQVASGINTFFGLTRRVDDPANAYLMGEAGLVTHDDPTSPGKMCDWYGYHALHDSLLSRPRPIAEPALIKKFSEAFGLADGRATPGLSVVVPYVDDKIDASELVFCAIDSYMLSLVRGDLQLEVLGGDDEHFSVDRSTLMKVLDQLEKHAGKRREEILEMRSMAELAIQFALAEQNDNWLELDATINSRSDEKGYSLAPRSENALAAARKECEASGRIQARVHVEVVRSDIDAGDPGGLTPRGSHEILVFGRLDQGSKHPNWNHVRCGLHVSKLRREGPTGSRGFVSVGRLAVPGLLAQLLQKSEEAAHDMWQLKGPEYKNAKASFEHARELIVLCRSAAARVAELVRPSNDVLDKLALASFLPVVSTSGPRRQQTTGPTPGQKAAIESPSEEAPAGVLEFAVYKWPGSTESHALANVAVSLRLVVESGESSTWQEMTDSKGRARFQGLQAGRYEAESEVEGVGAAVDECDLPEKHGWYRKLVLTKKAPLPTLIREALPDGFIIRFRPGYNGPIGRVVVRMAYAGYGGDVRFMEGDFDLKALSVHSLDVAETLEQAITRPNVIVVTPTTYDFELSIRGFNRRFALSVDARHQALDDASDSVAGDDVGGGE